MNLHIPLVVSTLLSIPFLNVKLCSVLPHLAPLPRKSKIASHAPMPTSSSLVGRQTSSNTRSSDKAPPSACSAETKYGNVTNPHYPTHAPHFHCYAGGLKDVQSPPKVCGRVSHCSQFELKDAADRSPPPGSKTKTRRTFRLVCDAVVCFGE